MGGMNRGIGSDNPLVVSAFHGSLKNQLLGILLLVVVLALAWNVARAVLLRREAARRDLGAAAAAPSTLIPPEPRARLVLRLAFGALWTLDGLLQLQPAMPLGLPGGVFAPSAAGAPRWVHDVVSVAVSTWTDHPITAATSAVWIQLGIGIALLVAPRGGLSRAAGVVSAAWGGVVWVFGEALGGIFTPGASWLFGLPGAALFYVVAGVLLALPETAWRTPRLGRWLLRGIGVLLVGMGVLQAWPGRGTWVGRTPRGLTGLTAAMANQMAAVPQPAATRSVVRWFATLDAGHGWSVNLVVVVALVAVGACLITADRRVAGIGVIVGVMLCLADWLLVQDLGFFGGVGTDPNSMVPTASLLVVGYLALRAPEADAARAADRPAPARAHGRSPAYLLQVAAAVCAAGIAVIGAAPMAVAALDPRADPILTQAVNGTPSRGDFPAWGFSLVDQRAHRVTLSQFRGRVVVLTFLDPVCTSDCPLIAQQLRDVSTRLRGSRPPIELVAIDANPAFLSPAALRAFDAQEQLTHVRNWEYLTGPLGELTRLWVEYGVSVAAGTSGEMSVHSDVVDVIDANGRVRSVIAADPGPTSATASSLGTVVAAEVQRVQTP